MKFLNQATVILNLLEKFLICLKFCQKVMESSHVSLPMLATEVVHRFSPVISTKNVELTNNNSTAIRSRNSSSAVVLSTMPLQEDDVFEIRLEEVQRQWAGALRFGVTTQTPSPPQNQERLAPLKDLSSLSGDVFWLDGCSVYHNGNVIKMNYSVTSLERLVAGDKLAVKRQSADGSLRFFINDEDCGK